MRVCFERLFFRTLGGKVCSFEVLMSSVKYQVFHVLLLFPSWLAPLTLIV